MVPTKGSRTVTIKNPPIQIQKFPSSPQSALITMCALQTPFSITANPTFSLLEKCKTMPELHQIHARMITTGLVLHTYAVSKVIAFCSFSDSGSLTYAMSVFRQIEEPNLFIWYALIRGFSNTPNPEQAILLYYQMLSFPNNLRIQFLLPFVLKSCSKLLALQEGRQIHGQILKAGHGLDLFVSNSMIQMYVKCREMEVACQVFDRMPQRDVVSWTMMVGGFVKSGQIGVARQLFDVMPERDSVAWNIMIDGYTKCGRMGDAQVLFDQMPERGLVSWNSMIDGYAKDGKIEIARRMFDEMPERDLVSWNLMIDGYVKCGKMEDAKLLFDAMPKRDVVSWTTMIVGYSCNNLPKEAIQLFREMLVARIIPDSAAIASVLSAIAELGFVEDGKWVHTYISRSQLLLNSFVVASALVDMYSKCGYIEKAIEVFKSVPSRSLGLWNSMISGLANHGLGEKALQIFHDMQRMEIEPDEITFLGILSACSHGGLVREGRFYFKLMRNKYKILLKIQHFGCMIDLLGRAGYVKEAYKIIEEMPMEPDIMAWKALLSACSKHGHIKIGEHAASRIMELAPHDSSGYVLLSNIYAKAGQWVDVAMIRSMMKKRGVRKVPGCSSIVINGKMHEFLVGKELDFGCRELIVSKLEEVISRLKLEGYEPDLTQVLVDVEEEEKENLLSFHSEKMAIAFGLISIEMGKPIHVVKNLRVCCDCHSFSKFVSRVYKNEIILRDQNRFHHFQNGSCSCRDYW